ncbi:MAG TPA: DUF3999 domain-containing protein [Xanthomonadales bacterium]|nr:DUF3999 domain-containing protein [Xanthomonadales bacterium]
MRIALALACALVAGAAAAKPATRADYAWAWPISADTSAGAVRIVLPADVYAHVADPLLRDLAVYNAAGAEVPFGPIPSTQLLATVRPPSRDLPWFALPATKAGSSAGDTVHLTLARAADGSLSRLDLDVPVAPATAAARDVVVDLGDEKQRVGIDGLVLEWQPVAEGLAARYRVSGSDDLVDWGTIVPQAGIADLRQGEFALVRRRIELPGAASRYLLLQREDDGTPLVLARVTATIAPRTTPTAPARIWTDAAARPSPNAGEFVFESPGPLPIERIDVQLASDASVANVRVASRATPAAPWREQRAFTAFRLGGAATMRNDDQSVDVTRDRWWRIVAESPLDAPPTLRVAYRPEEFALLPRGDGPYSLVAGSATARRSEFPIAALLAEVRSRLGMAWQPSDAALGERAQVSGAAALVVPPKPVDVKQWALWAILVGGAFLVLGMVLRLMRSDERGARD